MTAHPQTQPLPGTVPTSPPAPPTAQELASQPKGASRNARIALGLSALVAIAGISFAIGHVTAEEAASGNITPFADGAAPAAAGVAQAAADAGSDIASVELVETAQADPAGPPDAGAGRRPGFAGAPAGSEE